MLAVAPYVVDGCGRGRGSGQGRGVDGGGGGNRSERVNFDFVLSHSDDGTLPSLLP